MKQLFLTFIGMVLSMTLLSGCKVLVDPSGKYTIELGEREVIDQILPPGEVVCDISNCHGAEITCGDPVEMCTAEYRLGDFCRQFGECEIANGVCQVSENKKYTGCVACIKPCSALLDQQEAFACETKCRAQFE